MKKIILTCLISMIFILTIRTGECSVKYVVLVPKKHKELSREVKYEILVEAIEYTESRHNPNAVGGSLDYGLFQITPIRVEDFNRKTGKNYSHSQMFDPVISREIFDYYANRIGIDEHNFQKIALRWNGGGDKNYWSKVRKRYRKLINDYNNSNNLNKNPRTNISSNGDNFKLPITPDKHQKINYDNAAIAEVVSVTHRYIVFCPSDTVTKLLTRPSTTPFFFDTEGTADLIIESSKTYVSEDLFLYPRNASLTPLTVNGTNAIIFCS